MQVARSEKVNVKKKNEIKVENEKGHNLGELFTL